MKVILFYFFCFFSTWTGMRCVDFCYIQICNFIVGTKKQALAPVPNHMDSQQINVCSRHRPKSTRCLRRFIQVALFFSLWVDTTVKIYEVTNYVMCHHLFVYCKSVTDKLNLQWLFTWHFDLKFSITRTCSNLTLIFTLCSIEAKNHMYVVQWYNYLEVINHTVVFMSAHISSLSVDNGPKA